jgi:hypothetical protein
MRWEARVLGAMTVVFVILGITTTTAVAAGHHTIVVTPGNSIQAAIDAAQPGDTVLVKAGTYHEDVFITTDNVTLRGVGRDKTIIEPPAAPPGPNAPFNLCDFFFGPAGAGVCVFGQVDFNTGNVIKAVTGVQVSSLTVHGFATAQGGAGVFGYGTDKLKVTHVDASNNASYGISRFASTRTLFEFDRAWGSGEAGFYVGDSPQADSVVKHNEAWGNDLGIFVRHARGVNIMDNNLHGNCFGILVLNDGNPDNAGAGATIRENSMHDNNVFCPGSPDPGGPPPHGGAGVVLLGADHSLVADNEISGNTGSAPPFAGGVVVLSTAGVAPGGVDAMDNTVRDNEFRDNAPVDIFYDGKGSGNRFLENDCTTSVPPGLCTQSENHQH